MAHVRPCRFFIFFRWRGSLRCRIYSPSIVVKRLRSSEKRSSWARGWPIMLISGTRTTSIGTITHMSRESRPTVEVHCCRRPYFFQRIGGCSLPFGVPSKSSRILLVNLVTCLPLLEIQSDTRWKRSCCRARSWWQTKTSRQKIKSLNQWSRTRGPHGGQASHVRAKKVYVRNSSFEEWFWIKRKRMEARQCAFSRSSNCVRARREAVYWYQKRGTVRRTRDIIEVEAAPQEPHSEWSPSPSLKASCCVDVFLDRLCCVDVFLSLGSRCFF